MGKILQIITSVIPKNKVTRYVYRAGYKQYLSVLWGLNYRKYLRCIDKGRTPGNKLIRNLFFSWGNHGWSAKENVIESLIHYACTADSFILECGCGLSTMIIGPIAKKRNVTYLCLEHNKAWVEKVKGELTRFDLDHVRIECRELVNYGDFDWYDINNLDLNRIDLCICDGPPGETLGGRKGFLYLLGDNVRKGTIILVDDTIREEEQRMIEEWKKIRAFTVQLAGTTGQHAILTIQ